MIARLRGTLLEKSAEEVVVEVGGVGLSVAVPAGTLYSLPDLGSSVDLFIHTHVRENGIQLIGFCSPQEREAFRALLNITGIGPRLAVTILSGIEVPELYEAIVRQDVARLQAIPGVGRKLAARIVVELKDKIPSAEIRIGGRSIGLSKGGEVVLDVLSALMNLGYKRGEAEKALGIVLDREFRDGSVRVEDLLRASLRQLTRGAPHGAL